MADPPGKCLAQRQRVMQTVHYRRWAPEQSSLKIEFPSGLLREIRAEVESDHERGTLFGSHQADGNEIRALTARRNHEAPKVAGMELVGVYICRTRGEVFLTDDDLLYMEQFGARMALVMAGNRAGFFVRDGEGSIQAVRSYEEFLVADAAPQSERLSRAPSQPPHARHPDLPAASFLKSILILAAVLALPAGAVAYLRPRMIEQPVALKLKTQGEQLIATWDPSETVRGGRLEITDAGVRTMMNVAPGASSAVYQLHNLTQIGNSAIGAEVVVRITAGTRTGMAEWSPEHFAPVAIAQVSAAEAASATLPPEPLTPEAAEARESIRQLELEVKKLRWVEAGRQAQLVDLAKQAEKLSRPPRHDAQPRLLVLQPASLERPAQ
jgi:hypothetical protein